jgi:hypothetical protein
MSKRSGALEERLNAAQAHVDAELKQLVLGVFRQMIGQRDGGGVVVFR